MKRVDRARDRWAEKKVSRSDGLYRGVVPRFDQRTGRGGGGGGGVEEIEEREEVEAAPRCSEPAGEVPGREERVVEDARMA